MNNDLISRSALLENYGLKNAMKYGNETVEQQHNSYSTLMLYEIAEMIEDAPAVDAVEVVRCKDCKHFLEYSPAYEGEVRGADGDCFIRLMHTEYEPQFCAVQKCDFCSFGERNEVRQ